MNLIVGVSAGFHDGAVSVVDHQGRILFAAHSERYSKLKNDPGISPDLLQQLPWQDIGTVAYFERPWIHNLQQWVSRQKCYGPWTLRGVLKQHLGARSVKQVSFPHHLSHAAAGFQTSQFHSAAVVIIDAIGELDTISIYRAWYDDQGRAQYRRMWRQGYPHSIGLFYSAMTQRVGLRAMDEEYITMGMAAYGNRVMQQYMSSIYVSDIPNVRFANNLHAGIDKLELGWMNNEDIAACAQAVAENLIDSVMQRARDITGETNLVYGGGVALNCVANRLLGRHFNQIWIMPNPGDAGSSLGAAALHVGKKLQWRDAFLGHDIPGEYPVTALIEHLCTHGIAAVA